MLLALVPLLGLYAQNANILPVTALARPGCVLVGLSALVWAVGWAALGDRYRAGLIASSILVPLIVTWGVLEDLISAVVPFLATWTPAAFYAVYVCIFGAVVAFLVYRDRSNIAKIRRVLLAAALLAGIGLVTASFALAPLFGRRAAWMIAAYLIATVFVIAAAWRYEGDFKRATRSLNWFAAILLGLYAASVFVSRSPAGGISVSPLPLSESVSQIPKDRLPDIYFIALDGYARSDILRSEFSYNNLTFEDGMKTNGFQIVPESHSNYTQAVLSLTACLNMEYLHAMGAPAARTGADMNHAIRLYHDNRVFKTLREIGYSIVAFSPGLESLEPRSEGVAVLAPPHSVGEFEMVLLDRTVASRVMQAVYYLKYQNPAYWRYAFRRERILYAFDEMARLAQTESSAPRLIFANLLIPEPPYLFTRDGGRAQPFGQGSLAIDRRFRGRESEYRAAYLDQVHFTNQKLLETTQRIIEGAKRPSVILIASSRGAPVFLERSTAPPETRYRNLILVRFPDGTADSHLYDSMSLVNLFRVTLNRIVDAGLPILEDRIIDTSEESPFQLAPAR